MADLSAAQLADFQGDIGIGSDEAVFTDAELNRLYTRADSDYNKAVVLAIRQMLASAVKLNDYRIAQSSESRSQIYKQLKDMLTYWESVAQTTQQVTIVGMRAVPPRYKTDPD